MKKKEVLRRLSAISMSAMMTVTMVPSTAFAADEIFSDAETEITAEADEAEEDISAAEDISDADLEEETPVTDEDDISGSVDTEESGDSEETPVFTDDESNAEEVAVSDAGEGTPAADATVHMTVSVSGSLASAKDGTLMADRDVTVKDLDGNGILTYDEALVAAHNEYYEGGSAAGYGTAVSEQYGLYLTKFWGDESGAFGYWVNDASCNSLSDPVKADDYLNAYVYKDKTAYSDAYTRFEKNSYEATAGMPVTVAVQKATYDESYNMSFAACEGSTLTAYDSSFKALAQEDYTVDGYKVTFAKAGTYYLATGGTDSLNLVPAVAKVTVKEKTEEKQYLQTLDLQGVSYYEPGQSEYTCKIPAINKYLRVRAKISDTAPEGSTVTAKYYDYSAKKEVTKVLPTYATDLRDIVDSGLETDTFTITVGKDEDVQVYTIHITRSVYMVEKLTLPDGSAIPQMDGVMYLSENTGDSIAITVNGYGAKLDVNGTPVESNEQFLYKSEFDANNECKIVITGTHTNGVEKESREYIVKKLTPDDSFSGTSRKMSWSLKNGTLTISGTGNVSSYKPGWDSLKTCITSVVVEEGITGINSGLFNANYTALKDVTLPQGLTKCSSAFRECPLLENVTTGSLGSSMFADCPNLKNVTLQSVEEIPSSAFKNCTSLTSITLPEGVKTIGDYAFEGCTSLAEVNLPSTLENLSGYIFKDCTSLRKVTVAGDHYVIKDEIVYTADMKTLVFCPPTYRGAVNIPDGVTAIGDGAFFYCSKVTDITFPESLTTIGADAFCGAASLKKAMLPESVTAIGEYTFQECAALTEVRLPSTLTAITKYMFKDCGELKEISIPSGVTTIGDHSFSGCAKLKKIELPSGVTTIDRAAFAYCSSITELSLPEGVTQIPAYMLQNATKLETLYLPAGIKSVGTGAFAGIINTIKYIVYEGTPEQWAAITGAAKPSHPTYSAIFLYGAKSIGDQTGAPVITEQPQEQGFAVDEDAKDTLKVKADVLKENEKYYITWFKNTQNTTEGGTDYTGTMTEDGLGSTATPSTDIRKNDYYYCLVEKVDANGVATWTYSDVVVVTVGADLFQTGNGTKTKPYELNTAEDLTKLKELVKDGNSMENTYFQLSADITLPEGWTPIGETIDGSNNIQSGRNLHAFSGIFDGNNKTITVPEEGLPLFGYVKGAEIKNLNIYGKKIAGYGLINNFEGVGLSGTAAVIDNVTLKRGSSTLKSGFLGGNITTNGFAGNSAGFAATVRNCTIEKDVVIGYNKDQRIIGSIAGRMQGTVENCVSYATVYGTEYVGGIIGSRDNAMGTCEVLGCSFYGTVEASGEHAGGIVGGGYENSTAPNGIHATINNCVSAGIITGADKVGGILGADTFIAQAWNAYTMKGNSFTGTVKATDGRFVGGIIGYYDSLNKFDDIANNYYSKDCGAAKGIGYVKYVDTSCTTHETESGAIYFSTENGTTGCPSVTGCNWRPQHNRTDDPLGADADKLANTEGVKIYAEKLTISGDYATEFYLGEDLDLTGMKIQATMSDGETKDLQVSDVEITGYNKEKRGQQTLVLSYEGASEYILIKVLKKDPEDIKVSFELLGDDIHNSEEDKNPHTLRAGNLKTWIENQEYVVGGNATVLDVMEKVLTDNRYDWDNTKGNYIASITKPDGSKLGEFTNGQNSGWMYTLNGIHSDLGVSEQYLEDGDVIVFHYTDDYNLEHDHIWGSSWSTDENAHWHECTYEFNDCDITDNTQKAGYGEHTFDEGKVTTEPTCTEAGVKTYTCMVCGYEKTEEIPAAGHKFGSWKTVSKATVFAPKKEERKCSNCGKKETRNSGSKLKATIKLNVTSITLQKKQSTKAVKVTMANGDSVKSWTVGNKKIATVSKTGVIKAGTKTGTTKVTVTLKSGKKATLKVKVQAGKVKTTKISGLKSKVILKKGQKLVLKPVLSPVASQEKVTYASSNKKVVTVSKNGTVVAKKKGTAKITVKSGTQKYTIKVTVK